MKYQKSRFFGRIFNFHSQHTFKQKINLTNNLKCRAIELAHQIFDEQNVNRMKTIEKNSYSVNLVIRVLNKTARRLTHIGYSN